MRKRKSTGMELRSEKVRNLLGEIPPFLVEWGHGNNRSYILDIANGRLFCALSSFTR